MSLLLDRRQFLVASGALVATAGSLRSAQAADAGSLRLEFWGSQGRADRTYKVTDLYKKDKGVAVQGQFFGWGDYWPKLATETAGGAGPDVEQMDYGYIVEYAVRKAIQPMDPYLGSILDEKAFDKDQIAQGIVNGKLYGISLGSNSVAMMVNAAMWKEAGVDLPDRNTTWDEFAKRTAAVTKAKVRGGVHGTVDASGFTPAFENWVRQRGKAMYTAEGKLAFDADDLAEWLQMWVDMRKAGSCIDAGEQATWTGTIATDPFSMGKAAATFNNSNQLVGYQQINKDPLTMSNYPRAGKDGKGGHFRKASMFFSIGGDSKDPKAAMEFINFFVTNPDAGKMLGVERGVPAAPAVRKAILPSLDKLDTLVVNFISNLGDLAGPVPPPPPPHAGEVGDAFTTMSQQVGFGQASPKVAAADFVKQAEQTLARKV